MGHKYNSKIENLLHLILSMYVSQMCFSCVRSLYMGTFSFLIKYNKPTKQTQVDEHNDFFLVEIIITYLKKENDRDFIHFEIEKPFIITYFAILIFVFVCTAMKLVIKI